MGAPVGIGLFLQPVTGQVLVAPGLGVALAVAGFVAAVLGGLATVRLVMP